MRIISTGKDWQVIAFWHGADRTVFRGTVFECLSFVRKSGEEK